MSTFNWVIVLLLVALSVAVLEVFVPSGGILGAIALVTFLAAVLLIGFEYGPAVGFACLGVAVVVVPVLVAWVLRWWPNSTMGRRILPEIPGEDDVRPDDDETRALQALVGQVGRAKTIMLPSGAAVVDGRTVNAISEGMPIEEGQLVRVVEVRANRIVVRPAEGEESEPVAENDLSRPIDTLGLDPLDDVS